MTFLHILTFQQGKGSQLQSCLRLIHMLRSLTCKKSSKTDNGAKKEAELTKGNKTSLKTNFKVFPVFADKSKKKQDTLSMVYQQNIFISPIRAMNEYGLSAEQLKEVKEFKKRSPYPEMQNITVYSRLDVERRAAEIYGSAEQAKREQRRKIRRQNQNAGIFNISRPTPVVISEGSVYATRPVDRWRIFKSGKGRVIIYAIATNSANCVLKLGAWLYTGSHSMFAEFIHSAADTANQIILAIGLHQSLKSPDAEHPYGWENLRNVSSLISGVGIFCLGAGVSVYHGIQGLMHPEPFESLFWAIAVLGGTFVSEGAVLMVAIKEVRSAAAKQHLSAYEYIQRGIDPSTNVVLFEDAAAVVGVAIAASCMAVTHVTGVATADAVGSLLIGGLLGLVSWNIISTNSAALVGRSISEQKKMEMQRVLEDDRVISQLHDVKATSMGGDSVRFKAEVDFDGREVAKMYLREQDLAKLLQEMKALSTAEDAEEFLAKHGSQMVEGLGKEIDRVEKILKDKYPEIRHVDLEQL